MKIGAFFLLVGVAIQSLPAQALESPTAMIDDFNPLIARVRGTIRFQIEQGKGCFPWAILATDPQDEKTFSQIGFNQEVVDRIGGSDAKTVSQFVASAPSARTATLSVVGTCETDATVDGARTSNVIALALERRDGAAYKLRFPFLQNSAGKLSYDERRASGGPTEPLLFGSAKQFAALQAIAIAEQDQYLEVTVPLAKLAIRVPKMGFKVVPAQNVGGATASPRYFMLRDEVRGVGLSGWFEPASAFEGVKDTRPGTLQGKTILHQNVSRQKAGDWDTLEFDMVDESLRLNMANMHAHLVRAGSWVELHLSSNSMLSLTEQHALLSSVLRSIQIVER